jgi:Tol biopolymer transport system component
MKTFTITSILLLLAFSVHAQDNWGPAEFVSDDNWGPACDSSGLLYGYQSPAVSSNDSLLFFIPWCLDGRRVAYSRFQDGSWQTATTIADSIIDGFPTSIFYRDTDSTLYFTSDQRLGIWKTAFRNGIWHPAVSLGNVINSTGAEACPSFTADGSSLYFIRYRTICHSAIIDGEFTVPDTLPENINNPDSIQWFPSISPDGAKLYFNRRGYGLIDPAWMYVSTFSDGQWQIPMVLNTHINFGTPNPECMGRIGTSLFPSFSCNGNKMYFEYSTVVGMWCEQASGIFISELQSGVSDDGDVTPAQFSLAAYPNPFNAEVSISISGDMESISELAIYNIAGQKVRNLPIAPSVIWDGKDATRHDMASGIYFVQAAGDGVSQTIKVALVR